MRRGWLPTRDVANGVSAIADSGRRDHHQCVNSVITVRAWACGLATSEPHADRPTNEPSVSFVPERRKQRRDLNGACEFITRHINSCYFHRWVGFPDHDYRPGNSGILGRPAFGSRNGNDHTHSHTEKL